MKFLKPRYSVFVLLFAFFSLPLTAEEEKKDEDKAKDEIVETTHTITIQGEEIAYRARTGTILMKTEHDKPQAKLFFIAYEKEDVENPAERPITFAFNGGPGSSSVWLHLGVLGPQRVDLDEDGYPYSLPFNLVDNEYSILDKTDLVFIDPISTGYSRTVEGVKPSQYHGIQKDIRSVGEFIRLFTTRYERWDSPKFIAGESYGTTRASGLSEYLLGRYGMYLNGVILVSSVLDFQTIHFGSGNDQPFILFLPSYTATAWYHGQLDEELQQRELPPLLADAREFAMGDYANALRQGSSLPEQERERIARELAKWTGLSETYIKYSNLRIDIFGFTKELLRDKRRTVGRFDSRYKGVDREATGERHDYDPSYTVIQGAYTAALNHYVRSILKFESDLPYEILTGRVHPWDWGPYENRYVNVAQDLRQAMTKNPYMQVMVLSGYYDLATPYLAAEYTFDHLGLAPVLRNHLHFTYYDAGHMMYLHEPSLKKMKQDLDRFIQTTLEETSEPIQRY
ncbi:peptidase S10 [bacterium]|nr:peptidase S10 [bacterium]